MPTVVRKRSQAVEPEISEEYPVSQNGRIPANDPENASVRLVGVCEVFNCASARDVEQGQKLLNALKQVKAEVEAHHRPVIQKAHEAHKAALDALKRFTEPLDYAANRVKAAVNGFIQEEKRKAEEEARKERERLAAIAREEARIEQERREAEAKARREAEGDPKVISPFLDPEPEPEPEPVEPAPIPEVKAAVPDFKAMGARTRKTWVWEVEDIRELCRGVAEGEVDPDFVQPNSTLINTKVRQQKEKFACPGIRAFEKEAV